MQLMWNYIWNNSSENIPMQLDTLPIAPQDLLAGHKPWASWPSVRPFSGLCSFLVSEKIAQRDWKPPVYNFHRNVEYENMKNRLSDEKQQTKLSILSFTSSCKCFVTKQEPLNINWTNFRAIHYECDLKQQLTQTQNFVAESLWR